MTSASRFLPITLGALVALSGCDAIRLGAMNAAGPVADAERQLYVTLAIVLIFVAGPVLVLTPLIAWHYRLANKRSRFRPQWSFSWWLEGFIWLPPAGIVIGLSVLLWSATHQLDPYRPIAGRQPPLEIQAVALDWKWLFIYPGDHVAAVNQLIIPVGRAIHIDLTSGTVMQSLLIPQLAGQIYAMPGMRTQLNLAADRPGIYRGENTQYNGDGFAKEKFNVVALSDTAYRKWQAHARGAARPLDPAAFSLLAARNTVAQPVIYTYFSDNLFKRFMMRGQPHSGDMTQ